MVHEMVTVSPLLTRKKACEPGGVDDFEFAALSRSAAYLFTHTREMELKNGKSPRNISANAARKKKWPVLLVDDGIEFWCHRFQDAVESLIELFPEPKARRDSRMQH